MEKLGFDLDDGSSLTDMIQATPQETRGQSIEQPVRSLVHACQCRDSNCRLTSCKKMKRVISHTKNCKRKTSGGCPLCKQLIALCCYHGKHCQEAKCPVPFCPNIKHKLSLQKLQQRLQQVQLLRRPVMNNRTAVPMLMSGLSNTPSVSALTITPGNPGSVGSMSPPSTVSPVPSMSGMGSPHLPVIGLNPETQTPPANFLPMDQWKTRYSNNGPNQQGLWLPNQNPMMPLQPQLLGPEQNRQMIGQMRPVKFVLQQQPNPSQNNQQSKEAALQQLMQTLKNPQSGPEHQQQILQILKSNPQLMAAFIKQRQQHQNTRGGVNQQPGSHLTHMINQQRQENPQQQHQIVLQSGVSGPGQGQAPSNRMQNPLLGHPGQPNPQQQGPTGFGGHMQSQQYANFIPAPPYQQRPRSPQMNGYQSGFEFDHNVLQQMNVNNNQQGDVMDVTQQEGGPSPQHSLQQQMMHMRITADNLGPNGSDGLTAQDQLTNFVEQL